ncbi:mitochondrial thiamine pyrophosphate transporter, partial [Cymbomonas tetramitiformis]
MARGLWRAYEDPNSETPFLKDGWCCLDGFVVVAGCLSVFSANTSAVKLLRVLRPLRSIKRFSGMRVLVGTVLASLPLLANVLLLLFWLMSVFSIFMVIAFQGTLRG